MIEAAEVKVWLTSTLLAALAGSSAAGKVFDGLADDDTPLPYVIYTYTPQPDLYVVSRGKLRVWSPGRWAVLAVCEGTSYRPITQIADLISSTLHGATGTTERAQIGPCVRVQPLEYFETDDGMRYNYRGAEFDIKVKAR
jgi:hypothetical protein